VQNRLLSRGFTLIELLIVVAIIAILAAIAVPNFLEAQTRAKVSRAKSDMRTMATAIESYFVDKNKYPSMKAVNSGTALNRNSVFYNTPNGISGRFIVLTTPISYISSVFGDPFIPPALKYAKSPDTLQANVADGYDGYDYVDALSLTPNGIIASPNIGGSNRASSLCSGANWHIVSAGPDGVNAFGGGQLTNSVAVRRLGCDYDPTNGTISAGDIVRIGTGPGPQSPTFTAQFNRVTNIWQATP